MTRLSRTSGVSPTRSRIDSAYCIRPRIPRARSGRRAAEVRLGDGPPRSAEAGRRFQSRSEARSAHMTTSRGSSRIDGVVARGALVAGADLLRHPPRALVADEVEQLEPMEAEVAEGPVADHVLVASVAMPRPRSAGTIPEADLDPVRLLRAHNRSLRETGRPSRRRWRAPRVRASAHSGDGSLDPALGVLAAIRHGSRRPNAGCRDPGRRRRSASSSRIARKSRGGCRPTARSGSGRREDPGADRHVIRRSAVPSSRSRRLRSLGASSPSRSRPSAGR